MQPSRSLLVSLCSAALVVGGGSVLPSTAAPAPALPGAPSVTTGLLAKGTPVRVRLETPLRSGQCKVGDRVAFTVAEDVFGPGGGRLLAKGSEGVGHVTESAGHHSFGRAGRLAFTCDAVFGGGLRIPVRLSVRPSPPSQAATPPPAPPPTPLNDLHAPNPVPGDVMGGTPLSIGGQITRSTTGTFTLGGGADATASPGDEFEAAVATDTSVSLLPPLPGGAVPPGAGVTVKKLPNGTLVITPPPHR